MARKLIYILLIIISLSLQGCNLPWKHKRVDKVSYCRVYAAQTLQYGDNPEMSRVKDTPYYLLKLRWGINEPDEDNSVLIIDPVLGFGRHAPNIWEIKNLNYRDWGEWSGYATLVVDGTLEIDPILMAGYWKLEKDLPQILEYRDYRIAPVRIVKAERTNFKITLLDCGWDKSWDNKHMRKWADLKVEWKGWE